MFQLNRENPITQLKQKISVKVEETYNDEDQHVYFYKSDVDNFDSFLYESCLRNSDINKNYLVKLNSVHVFKYKFSQNLYTIEYREPVGVERFDNLSNAPPFKSRDLGLVIKSEYKKLNQKTTTEKFYKKNQKVEISICEDFSLKKYQTEFREPQTKQEESVKEETSFRLMKKKPTLRGFLPTHMVKTSELNIVFSGISLENIDRIVKY